jgi:hypothetical protein
MLPDTDVWHELVIDHRARPDERHHDIGHFLEDAEIAYGTV